MARLKILHADDEEGWRELVGFWLAGAGYEVKTLDAGKKVLERARQFRPDCFLLDHDLGDTTGHEVCKALKASAEFRTTPVIIMTAHAAALPAVAAEFPPEQFIVKSNHPEELLFVLDALLTKKP